MFYFIVVIILGLFLGSFANVCIYRIPIGLSVATPRRSFCPWCERKIEWHRNIPVLSFLWQRARCAHCSSRISSRYFLVEILMPTLWAAFVIANQGLSRYATAYVGIALFFAIVTTFIDLDWRIIPDSLSFLWLGIVLLVAPINPLSLFVDWQQAYLTAFSGSAAAAFVVWMTLSLGRLIKRRDVMGWGDVKLMACWGGVLGWFHGGMVFFVAAFLATFWIVVCFAFKRLRSNEFLPFGPFINLAGILVLWKRLAVLSLP